MNDPPHFEAKSLAQKPGTSDFVENGVPLGGGDQVGVLEGIKVGADAKDLVRFCNRINGHKCKLMLSTPFYVNDSVPYN